MVRLWIVVLLFLFSGCKSEKAISINDELFAAVKKENCSVANVKELVSKGATLNAIDRNGNTIMTWAASTGNLELVTYLVEQGQSVHKANSQDGNTPLMMAAVSGNKELVTFLLSKGANVSTENKKGRDAYRFAEMGGHYDLASYLNRYAKERSK